MPALIFPLLACLILAMPLTAQEISWVKTFQSIDVALVVRDYDVAIEMYTEKVEFKPVEDISHESKN